ncbi:MAG: integrase core domain-containing protein [Gammaproteobacteria bacterium]
MPCATPNKDAHIEAFYSIIETEFLRTHYFNVFQEAYDLFYGFVTFYNENRVHGSIGCRTPLEVINIYMDGGFVKNIKRLNI